jgi:hypothetical protein
MEWLDMRDPFLRCSCSASCPSVEERRNHVLGGLKAQTTSFVLTTRLSSMYAPIIPLTLIFVAFGCQNPDDKL